jgi:uncharacterized SAM-binding protein YcdF (DUF218 family)
MNRTAAVPRLPRSAERGGIILKLMGLLLLLVLLAGVWLLRDPLLRVTGESLIVDEAPQPSDAIVVLGNDNYWGERAARAAGLFHDRWAPRVIASGAQIRPYASIADLIRRDLIQDGVPADAVVHFSNNGGNTRGEAYAVRELMRERGWKRLIVVTSNYHTRRARYIYRRVLDRADVRVVSAPDSTYNPRTWWQSRLGLKIFFREYLAFAVALVEMQTDEPDASKLLIRPAPPAQAPTPAPAPAR